MVATTTFYLEGQDQAKIALTREGLSTLLAQVEAELQRSETYQQALNRLSQGMTETSQNCQSIIRAVGREAIRLALRQVVRQYRTTPPPVPPSPFSEAASTPLVAPALDQVPEPAHVEVMVAPLATVTPEECPPEQTEEAQSIQPLPEPKVVPSQSVTTKDSSSTPSRLIPKPAPKPPSPEEEKRAAILQQIGQTLEQARQSLGLSLEQLHLQTWIPIHQLRALELGQADRLPEDVYIQGFLRRIAPVLKLDSTELQAPLKGPQIPKNTAVASWQQRSPSSLMDDSSPSSLQPMHLYVGYAALMAGAAGGLVWMSNQSHAERWVPQGTELQPEAMIQSTQDEDTLVAPAGGGGGAIATPETAPPQALR